LIFISICALCLYVYYFLIIIHLIIKFTLVWEIYYTKSKTMTLRGSVPSSSWIKVKGQMVQWDAHDIKEARVSEGEWLIVEQSLLCVHKKKNQKEDMREWTQKQSMISIIWHVHKIYHTILIYSVHFI